MFRYPARLPSVFTRFYRLLALLDRFPARDRSFTRPRTALALESLEAREVPSTTVYNRDFDPSTSAILAPGVTAGWSQTNKPTSPSGESFLGEFGNQAVTLTLNNLPAHDSLNVEFDLYLIRTWDGNDPTWGGPNGDRWSFSIDGQTQVDSTFRNARALGPNDLVNGQSQDYGGPDAVGSGPYESGTGAVSSGTLGYTFTNANGTQTIDSVYHFSVPIEHAGSTVTIRFAGSGLQGLSDESWGIDNVQVVSDSLPVVTVATVSNATEGGTSPDSVTMGYVVVSRTGSTNNDLSVTLDYQISDAHMADKNDYTAPLTVNIPAGASSVSVAITPKKDNLVEGDEVVRVALSAGEYYWDKNSAFLSIVDDPPLVTIIPESESVLEGESTQVTLQRSGGDLAESLPLFVRVDPDEYQAAEDTTDFTAVIPVEFAANETEVTLDLSALSDNLVEGDEWVWVRLADRAMGATSPAYTIDGESEFPLLIDDQTTPITIETSATPNPVDPDSEVAFSATAEGGSGSGYMYTWDFGDESAAATGANPTHTYLAPGVYSVELTVTDSVGNEEVTWIDVSVTDTVTVSATGNASETGDQGSFTFTRIGTVGSLIVTFSLGGTADPDDYNPLSLADEDSGSDQTIVIPDGQSSVTVPLVAVQDNLVEDNESITVTVVQTSTSQAAYTVGNPDSASINITDDPPMVSVSAGTNAAEAGRVSGIFTLSRSGGRIDESLTVWYSVGGEAEESLDYEAVAGMATIPAGATSIVVIFTPNADNELEGDESVILTLISSDQYQIAEGHGSAESHITDDPPIVTVVAVADADEKNGQTGQFRFTRSGGDPSSALTVYFHAEGTAESGTDYTALADVVTFDADETEVLVDVEPLADNTIEEVETVSVHLADGNYQDGNSTPATLSITDDSPVVNVFGGRYVESPIPGELIWSDGAAIAENKSDYGLFRFRRAGGDVDQPLTVSFTLTGTATNGDDFSELPLTVTFDANNTEATLDVRPLRDNQVESTEAIVLVLSSSDDYQFGDTSTATIPLADEPPLVSVTAIGSAAEPNRSASLNFTRSGGDLTQPVTVTYAVTGSATSDTDYVGLSGTVTFSADITTVIVPVTVLDDTAKESSESIVVTLSASSDYFTVGSGSATVSIDDDDNNDLVLTLTQSTITEGQSAALTGMFTAPFPDAESIYFVTINWADGSELEELAVAGDIALFTATHTYTDDGVNAPGQSGNGTASDQHRIQVTVVTPLDATFYLGGGTNLTVDNAAPSAVEILVRVPSENEVPQDGGVIIEALVTDVGEGDFHTISIDWGDGTPIETFLPEPHASFHHTYTKGYLPGETPYARDYTITVTAADDDEPNVKVSTSESVRVIERPPSISNLFAQRQNASGIDPIYENDLVEVTGMIAVPGSANWISITINWGDNTTPTPASVAKDVFGSITFTATHKYLDNRDIPFTITATATAEGYGDHPLTESTTATILNAAPSKITASIAGDSKTVRLSAGSFVDPGPLDTHKVVVVWGDGQETQPIDLPVGMMSFATDAALTHEYSSSGSYHITIKVYDKDQTLSQATTIAFQFVNVQTDILKTYFDTAQEISNGTIVDSVFGFANYLIQSVKESAQNYVNDVMEFYSQLQTLESELGKLFNDKLPQVLDALLTNPSQFVGRLIQVAKAGFDEFTKEDNLAQTLKDIALQWFAKKVGTGELTEADLPKVWTDLPQVAGFVLKVLGLTWDDLLAKLTTAVGPDNLAVAMEVYDAIKDAIADGVEGQAAIFSAFDLSNPNSQLSQFLNQINDPNLLANLTARVQETLNANNISDAAINKAKDALLKELPALILKTLAPLFTPAGAGFKAIQTAGNIAIWMVGNVNQVTDMVKVANELTNNIDRLRSDSFTQVDVDFVAGKLKDALKAVGPTVLDFLAGATGAGGLATAAGNAIKSLHHTVDDKLNAMMAPLKLAGEKLLAKLLPLGSAADDYIGLTGKPTEWIVNGERHRVWARYDPTTDSLQLMVASNRAIVCEILKTWENDWAGAPEMITRIQDARSALPTATSKLAQVDIENKKLRTLANRDASSLTAAEKKQLRDGMKAYYNAIAAFQPTINTTTTLITKLSLVLEAADYEISSNSNITNGQKVRIKSPTGYDAWWFKPTGIAFKDGTVRWAAYLDGKNTIGDPVQTVIDRFAADWDRLAWDADEKAKSGQADAIREALTTANALYTKYGMATVTYQTFMSSGQGLPDLPSGAIQADHDALGKAKTLAHGQRAAAKGIYIHAKAKEEYRLSSSKFIYAQPGIDLHSIAFPAVWLEIQKEGAWDQHSGTTFQAQVWRAIQY